jgi:quinol monooxygenase YgiN
MISASITVDVIPAKSLEFEQTIHALIEKLGNSKDCMESNIYRKINGGNSYCLMFEWRTGEAMKKHFKSKSFNILSGAVRNLCDPPRGSIRISAIIEKKSL